METSKQKERRSSIRIPILSEACTYTFADALTDIEGTLFDLSPIGVFINCKTQPNVKDIVKINFKLPQDMGILTLNGKVTHKRWAVTKKSKLSAGFGVKFEDNIPKYEEVMKSYAIYMRNKQIIQVSTRIIEEFFGLPAAEDKGPPNEKQ